MMVGSSDHTSSGSAATSKSTAGFFFQRDIAILNSLRMADESWMVEIALIKANSSCLSTMLQQEIHYTKQDIGLLMRPETV